MCPNKWERSLCPGVVPLPAGLEVQTRNRLCWLILQGEGCVSVTEGITFVNASRWCARAGWLLGHHLCSGSCTAMAAPAFSFTNPVQSTTQQCRDGRRVPRGAAVKCVLFSVTFVLHLAPKAQAPLCRSPGLTGAMGDKRGACGVQRAPTKCVSGQKLLHTVDITPRTTAFWGCDVEEMIACSSVATPCPAVKRLQIIDFCLSIWFSYLTKLYVITISIPAVIRKCWIFLVVGGQTWILISDLPCALPSPISGRDWIFLISPLATFRSNQAISDFADFFCIRLWENSWLAGYELMKILRVLH